MAPNVWSQWEIDDDEYGWARMTFASKLTCLLLLSTAIGCTGLKRPDMPLDPVCMEGRIDLLPTLLQNGGDVNEADANGDRPIYWCMISGRVDIAVELVRRGAVLDYVNSRGRTLEDQLKTFGHDEAYAELLKKIERQKKLSSNVK